MCQRGYETAFITPVRRGVGRADSDGGHGMIDLSERDIGGTGVERVNCEVSISVTMLQY